MCEKILQEIIFDNAYKNICKNLSQTNKKYNDIWKDLYQSVIVELATKPCSKLTEINNQGKLKFYFWGIAKNIYCSKNSEFYKQYRHFNSDKENETIKEYYENQKQDENEILELKLNKIENILNNFYWFNRLLFFAVLKEKNISVLSKKTKIPRGTISLIFNQTKKQIQNELQINNI